MSHNEERCMTPAGAMRVLKIIGMVLLGIIAVIAFGFVVQLLWNWLMPPVVWGAGDHLLGRPGHSCAVFDTVWTAGGRRLG